MDRIKLRWILIVGDFHWLGLNSVSLERISILGLVAVSRWGYNRSFRGWLVLGWLVNGTVRLFRGRFGLLPFCLVDGV